MDFENRPGLLEFHNAAVDRNVDILLLSNLSRLGRTSDATLQYWSLLCDLNVIVYTADGGKVDMSVDPLIEKIIELCKTTP